MSRSTWRDEPPRSSVAHNDSRTDRATAATRRDVESSNSAQTIRDGVTGHSDAGLIIRLPSALAGNWRIVRELESNGAEADLLIVTNAKGDRRVAKIYRAGIQPKTEVLQKLGGVSFEHVVQLFDHGRSDGRSYELLEYVEGGSLEDLIRKEGPKLEEMQVGKIVCQSALNRDP